MSPIRRVGVLIFTLVLMVYVVHESWSPREAPSSDAPADETLRTGSFEEFIFTVQSRLAVGALRASTNAGNVTAEERELGRALTRALRDGLEENLVPFDGKSADLARRNLARREMILLAYMGAKDAAEKRAELLRECVNCSDIEQGLQSATEQCLRTNSKNRESDVEPLPEADERLLADALGWHGQLCVVGLNSSLGTQADVQNNEVFTSADRTFRRITRFFVAALVLGFFGTLFLAFYLFLFLTGRTSFRFERIVIDGQWNLEIFALYLLLYTVLGKAVQPLLEWSSSAGFPLNRFLLGGGVILILPVVLFWPTLWGVPWNAVRRSVGLVIGGVRTFLKDLVVGPTFYLASWIPLFLVLILYSAVLRMVGIDVSQGTHPVVPILLGSIDNDTKIAIFVLAVVIAPFVEEIMFRGALYSWLRERLNPWLAIPISAFIFALVHPQGPVGLVPLTAIGTMLAFVREWRGGLIPCMLVHACVNAGTMAMIASIME